MGQVIGKMSTTYQTAPLGKQVELGSSRAGGSWEGGPPLCHGLQLHCSPPWLCDYDESGWEVAVQVALRLHLKPAQRAYHLPGVALFLSR